MRLSAFFLFFCLGLIASCQSSHELKAEEGNFKVNFPGEPSISQRNLPTGDGDAINVISYNYLTSDSNTIFVLSYNTIPNYASTDPDSILQNAKMGPAQAMRTSIVEEKKLDLNGYPGLYFKGLGLDIAMVYYIYVVKDRMYQMAILNREPREPTAAEVEGFMGTFRLLKKL